MILNPSEISNIIKKEIKGFIPLSHIEEAGRVIQIADGIVQVTGLMNVMSGELLRFENDEVGIAMNLEEHVTGVVLLGSDKGIYEDGFVTRTGQVMQIPVGDALLGRVVNALGEPLDQKGPIIQAGYRPAERVAPGVLARKKVEVPLMTGIKAIDSMVPIGRGQRQLIIGDRQTGKTAIALDTILNQKDTGVLCVYVAIGQKNSTIAGIVNILEEHGALQYTTIVAAGASEEAPLQYMAPYSGCAIAEEWMENGKDVLIIYDDLSKHAVAYRTLSLLLRRPPGREAYPGDVFYIHSRLLERAGRMEKEYGGGSITALPIIETLAGDLSAYIPTNVISITDGQIYLESVSFNAGIRPAINPGLSVSRVGGAAQSKAMKQLSGPLRIELAQYRELSAFAQFSSDLDADTKKRLNHGERIVEILKQHQYKPFSLEHQILSLYTMSNHYLEDIPVNEIQEFEQKLLEYFDNWHVNIIDELRTKQDITLELEQKIKEAIEQFIINYNS